MKGAGMRKKWGRYSEEERLLARAASLMCAHGSELQLLLVVRLGFPYKPRRVSGDLIGH